MVLMALLALGLCLQPVFAAACDVEDARSALGNDAGAAVIALDADAPEGANDCCANPACSDCCMHATASLPGAMVAGIPPMPRMEAVALGTGFRPSDYPVDVRPPIAS